MLKQLLDTETKQSQYFCAPKLIEMTYNLDILDEVELCLTGKRAERFRKWNHISQRQEWVSIPKPRAQVLPLSPQVKLAAVRGHGNRFVCSRECERRLGLWNTLNNSGHSTDSVFVCVGGKLPVVFPSHHHYCESFSFGWTVPLKKTNLLYLFLWIN